MPDYSAVINQITVTLIGVIDSQLLSISAICVSNEVYNHIKNTHARNLLSKKPLQFMGFELIPCSKLPIDGFGIICEGVGNA